MNSYVLGFEEINRGAIAVVGGKGAHLAELARIEGVRVPAGFCISTQAFRRVTSQAPALDERLDELTRLKQDDPAALRVLSAKIRELIEGMAMPDEVVAAIAAAHARLGTQAAYAIRSSATAEDLPTASFAGQQDTYLNVVGLAAVLRHVSRCWASLFSERAVTYRFRNGFDQRTVQLAVVVQQMLFPQAAGVLFTADPITGNRKISSVEASFGLGEALVAGLVNADRYQARDGKVIGRAIGTKQLEIWPSPAGGTQHRAIEPERQKQPALTDLQILQLVQLGRQIEAHFGEPQDIEWCLVNADFHVVQSRPITTLFPIPEVGDQEPHVYLSVGHQQMMTDPLRPLGLSIWQLTTSRPMYEAGGRLFVEVTSALAAPASRATLVDGFGRTDPLTGAALQTIADRGDFITPAPNQDPARAPAVGAPAPAAIENDPAIVAGLIERSQASITALKRDIQSKSGTELLDFILTDFQELRRLLLEPKSMQVIFAGMEAAWWINDHLETWLGVKNAADTLSQSVPDNITSEMGLALLDVADVIRPHSGVVDLLSQATDDGFLDELPNVAGGKEAQAVLQAWLEKYGMRGVGEIDIARPRFRERPSMLVPMLLNNIRNCADGASERRFEQGRQNAWQQEKELLERLRSLPDGEQKARETKHMIDRVRTFAGYREYPKYAKICREFIYKQALLAEAERLVAAQVLREKEDIFFLRFQELQTVVRTHRVDQQLLGQRKEAFKSYQALTPPRVLTSEGEAITGAYRREDLPAGALVGLAVSVGSVEGRARVILDVADAHLETGDILVTAYTDPSWTPLFVGIQGLVTEVGGQMTHGAVIAREYGVPAVVGVENATRLIEDGQRIRVNGTNGYVEVLSS
jgi:rifampicin phosphotransferase